MMYFNPGLDAAAAANIEARQNQDQTIKAITRNAFVEKEGFGGVLRRVACDAIGVVDGAAVRRVA